MIGRENKRKHKKKEKKKKRKGEKKQKRKEIKKITYIPGNPSHARVEIIIARRIRSERSHRKIAGWRVPLRWPPRIARGRLCRR